MKYLTFLPALILFICMSQYANAQQDWANTAKYQQENANLAPPEKDENRVVFMGNSITEAWGKTMPEFFEGKSYINRGISGQTTPQMLVRFRPDVIDLKPKLVLILAGTNDIAGNTGPTTLEMIRNNIVSMAQLAKANNIKVIICSVLPAYDYPWKKGLEPAEKIIALNNMLKDYAKEHQLIYLDYFSAMADGKNGLQEAYTYDGVHPNLAGYQVMAPLAEKAIKTAIGEE